MTENLSSVVEFWATSRVRLGLEEKIPATLSGAQMYTLLCQLWPEEVASYDFGASAKDLADVISIAMSKTLVPASLVEALELGEPRFENEMVAEWPGQAISVIGTAETSLESKVSAAEVALLYGPDETRTRVLDQLGSALDTYEPDDFPEGLPERTQLAIGLVGALTGQYLADGESGSVIEYLTKDNLTAAIKLLNRWRLHGRLWQQVTSSEPDVERDSLLRALHQVHPTLNYVGVQPGHFKADEISALESRVGRPVLLHLVTQVELEAWIQYIRNLDLGAGQLPLLQLVLEGRPDDAQAIFNAINEKLAQTNQVNFSNNLTNREDGYTSFFELEHHGEIKWPDAFFEAAIDVLCQKGWIFKTSKVPQAQWQRIFSGVWSKVVSGRTDLPTSLLQDHVGPYVREHYHNGAREEFTEKVMPALISGSNPANLEWAIDFLFARHRRKSTIPDASDAQIQEAITRVYPHSQGDMKEQIERLVSKKWFSLPSRPDEEAG